MSRRKTAALCFIKGTMSGCFCNKYPELIFHTLCFSVFKKGIQTAIFPGRWLSMEPQAVSHDATHFFFILVFCFVFLFLSVIHKRSVTWPPPWPYMCLNLLADIFGSSKGTDVFGKEAIKSQS